ncbi:35342_t:CDS:2 [Gigaspora margarita]|uniref:35342_t:CDS:1 n=1 Tax=Gigaspora margarita TaxID=4874 RepID=A0ABM8VYP1_GIGMA|nr:35342_t:CDS:2 [Gigaspora margarita]
MVALNKEEVKVNKYKTTDHYLGSDGKAHKILEWCLKSVKNLEDCKTGIRVKKNIKEDKREFEKALVDQDELLEVEVKDAKALVCQGFKQKGLALENQRGLEGLEAVHQFNNNHIRLKDQFQQSRVQSVHIDVENDRSNGGLLVSKMNDKKEDRKMDDLPELDREVIQNIKWDKNSKVVMPKIGMDTANIDNEIIDHLFNPSRSCW